MKKFTILMGLFLATVITGSAFAQSVTLTAEQVEKIEAHIIGLDKQIAELTAQHNTQSETIKTMMQIIKTHGIDFVEASKDPSKSTFSNKSSNNAEKVVSNLTSKTKTASKNNVVLPDCQVVGEFAYTVMTARQRGMAMSEVMKTIDSGWAGEKMATLIVQMAYEKSRYSSLEYRKTAAEDHRNIFESACYKEKNK